MLCVMLNCGAGVSVPDGPPALGDHYTMHARGRSLRLVEAKIE